MAYIYFFEKDKPCNWMTKEITESFPQYLYEPVQYEGQLVKFYLILSWVRRTNRGANLDWLNKINVNYVNSISDLPEGAGIYITGYDSDYDEFIQVKNKKIPIIDHACPWVRQLRNQLLGLNSQTHQAVIMIDKEHMVYDCYKSLIPQDAIIINEKNYEKQLRLHSNSKPINLMVYTVFRKKDTQRIIAYIKQNYSHPANILDGYLKTNCCWMKQGLFEEMEEMIPLHNLNKIWIICSSEQDRSTQSIINELTEHGASYFIIKKIEDIPSEINNDDRIGVLFAPIAMHIDVAAVRRIVKERFSCELITGSHS